MHPPNNTGQLVLLDRASIYGQSFGHETLDEDLLPTQVAFGSGHGCYIDAAGEVYCWGHNSGGKAMPPDLGGYCFTVIGGWPPIGPGW